MITVRQWLWWAALSIGGFLALELPALWNDVADDTLSEYVWAMGAWRFVVVGFLVWLTVHFVRAR